jgi:hypothetical protein
VYLVNNKPPSAGTSMLVEYPRHSRVTESGSSRILSFVSFLAPGFSSRSYFTVDASSTLPFTYFPVKVTQAAVSFHNLSDFVALTPKVSEIVAWQQLCIAFAVRPQSYELRDRGAVTWATR